jgi:hypothetical protein
MLSGLFKRKARRAERTSSGPEIPYQVECVCGQTLSGKRGFEAIIVKCPRCRARTLVFPSSPLTELRQTIRDGLRKAGDQPRPTTTTSPALWRKPLVAAGAAVTVVIVIFLVVLKSSLFKDPASNGQPPVEDSTAESIADARQAIADLNYGRAAEHFRAARTILRKKAGGNEGAEGRWLSQMEQEALAMADLLVITLQEVLQKAAGLSDRAWKEQFVLHFAGKTIVFDTTVHDVGSGIFRIDYPFTVSGLPGRIEVHHSVLLRGLKVKWPARCLVAIRLSEARREQGMWLVLGKPESVVLFTEPAFFQASTVTIDADLVELMKTQAGWLNVTRPQ